MADNNSILVSLDLDSKELEKQFKQVQSRLKNMTGISPGLTDSPRDMQMKQAFQRSEGMHREKLLKMYEKQDKIIDDLLKKEKELSEKLDGKIKNQKELNKLQQEYLQTTEAMRRGIANQQGISQALCPPGHRYDFATKQCVPDAGGGPGGGGPGGGGPGGGGPGGRLKFPDGGGSSMIPGILKVLGAVGSAVKGGGQIYKSITTQEERQVGARASIAGAVGELAGLQQQRRGYEMDFYGEERAKAAEASRNRMKAEKVGDITDMIGSLALKTATGAGAGYMAGTLGTGTPLIPFTAAGGTVIGGMAGFGKGVYDIMANDRQRSMIFDPEAYDQFVGAKGAEAYTSTLEKYKAENFTKVKAQEYFERNKENMVKMQRAFGLSDEELFGGEESLYKRAARAGFDERTINRSAMGIQQAGGTTKAGKEGAVFAAQMERGLDLTNAASLIGKISSRTGMGGAESKDEVIRMYAEATRIGLDESEVRGLLETSTQMALQSGISADEIQQALQSGLVVQSQKGIQAAQSAFERIKGKTGQMGGIRGQLAMAEFGSKEMTNLLQEAGGEGTKGFSFKEIGYITSQSVDKISADNDAIAGMLLERGIDPNSEQGKKIIAEMRKRSMRSTIKNKGREKALENYRKAQAAVKNASSPEAKAEAEKKLKIAYSKAAQFGAIEEGEAFGGQGTIEQKAETSMTAEGVATGLVGGKAADTKAVEEKTKKDTGRGYDQYMRSAADDFAQEIDRLTDEMGNLRKAFKEASDSNEIKELMSAMGKLAKAGDLSADAQKAYTAAIKKRQNDLNAQESQKIIDRMTNPQTNYVQYGASSDTED
jgi:hypothetical protein